MFDIISIKKGGASVAQNVDLQERLKMRFLTVAYRDKQETYGTCCSSADTGNVALDILNIPDTLEILRNYNRISGSLWRKLDKLRQYHNLTLHDPEMTVSQEMCNAAKEARTELESKN